MMRVLVHIDRLVLQGIDRADSAALAEGLQAELRALLRSDGAISALAAHQAADTVHAGKARVPQGTDAALIGRAVAGRIVRGESP